MVALMIVKEVFDFQISITNKTQCLMKQNKLQHKLILYIFPLVILSFYKNQSLINSNQWFDAIFQENMQIFTFRSMFCSFKYYSCY